MRTAILALCLSLVSLEAHAISRYNSESLTCGRAQAIVRDEGAVILRYQSTRNPGLPLYDRYVASDLYCDSHEIAQLSPVPTSDSAACPVAKCVPGNWLLDGDD